MKPWLPFILALAGLAAGAAPPAEAPPAKEDPAHEELRALYRDLVAAYNKGDFEHVFSYLDDDVVVTWQNAEVSRKPEGVRAYFDKMMNGPDRRVERITINPTVDELSHMYGNTAVAFGHSEDHYQLTDGMEFDLPTRWTATLVKKDGQWKIAAFQAAANMFDNPVLRIVQRRTALWSAAIGLTAGVLAGFLLAVLARRLRARRRATPA